jgi:hypothetical protein
LYRFVIFLRDSWCCHDRKCCARDDGRSEKAVSKSIPVHYGTSDWLLNQAEI